MINKRARPVPSRILNQDSRFCTQHNDLVLSFFFLGQVLVPVALVAWRPHIGYILTVPCRSTHDDRG